MSLFFEKWKDPVTGKMYKEGDDGKLVDSVTEKKPEIMDSELINKGNIEWRRKERLALESHHESKDYEMKERMKRLYAANFNASLDDIITYETYASFWYNLISHKRIKEWIRFRIRVKAKKSYERVIRSIISE